MPYFLYPYESSSHTMKQARAARAMMPRIDSRLWTNELDSRAQQHKTTHHVDILRLARQNDTFFCGEREAPVISE